MNQPCKDCEKRHVGCHGKCNDYKEWHKEHLIQKRKEWNTRYQWKDGYYHG